MAYPYPLEGDLFEKSIIGSCSQSDDVIKYISNQSEHHRKMTFQEEYRKFLERYQVPYDERYVWD
nr:hypothetical protein [Pedosphaera parvula]